MVHGDRVAEETPRSKQTVQLNEYFINDLFCFINIAKSLEIKEISKDVENHENVKKEDQEQDELLKTYYTL